MISLIVAYERGRGIGYRGGLLWGSYEMSTDMKRVRDVTRSVGAIIIGTGALKDGQIIPHTRPFPKVGHVIVLSRQSKEALGIPDVDVAGSVEEALSLAGGDAVVMGGAQVYRAMMPFIDTIYATEVDADLPHDKKTRFPDLQPDEWEKTDSRFVPAGVDHSDPKGRRRDVFPSYQVTYKRRLPARSGEYA